MKPDEKLNREDEMFMNEIRKKTSDIQVPDSLSPENMMKKLKESGGKGKAEDIIHRKKFKWNVGMLVAGAAVIFCVVMTGLAMKGNFLFGRSESMNNSAKFAMKENADGHTENLTDMSISRTEVLNVFKRQFLMQYAKSYDDMFGNDEMTKEDIASEENHLEQIPNQTTSNMNNSMGNDSITDEGTDTEYYKNNDQVEGVIEGDIVRTDGQYIYSTKEYSDIINIVKVNNGAMENVTDINYREEILKDVGNYTLQSKKMYIQNQKLVLVLGLRVSDNPTEQKAGVYNYVYDGFINNAKNLVYVIEYDISETESPQFAGKAIVEGRIISSRMAGSYLYVISEKVNEVSYHYYDNVLEAFADIEENALPKINGREVREDNIYHCGKTEEADSIQIICALDINDGLNVTSECATLVGGGDVYVSENNIYVMSLEYNYEDRDYVEDITNSMVDIAFAPSDVNTIINRYHYENGKVTACVQGKVRGSILNQFSVDEKDGYLRIVTTTDSFNSVYILDNQLNITGSLEGIAEGEHVESVRFMGNRVYFVTFRQTDPLFAADLSDVTKPILLDELKVTGFSSYLHTWTDGLLLGIGSEATEKGVITGAKISMFSTADDALEEVSRYVIDEAYLYDMEVSYKNIMVDAEKNLIGLGFYMDNRVIFDNDTRYDTSYHFNVYRYENNEIKNVLNYTNEHIDDSDMFYYDILYRGLYVGDYLYIITLGEGIQSISLKDMSYVQYLDLNS